MRIGRRSTLLCLTVMGAAALAGCDQQFGGGAPAPSTVFRSAEQGFSISFPPSWQVIENAAGTGVIVTATSPTEAKDDPFQENVNVVFEPQSFVVPAQAYMDDNRASMDKQLTDFRLIEEGTDTIRGKAIPWVIFTHRLGGKRIAAMQHYFTAGHRAYVVTCTALPETFDQHEAVFRRVCQGFRVE